MLIAEYIDYMNCYRLYDDEPNKRMQTIAYLDFEDIKVAEEDLQSKIEIQDDFEERCRDCCYLVEGDKGEWICDGCGLEIHKISDSKCSANIDF